MGFIKYLFSKKYRSEYSMEILDKLFYSEAEIEVIYNSLFRPIAA